MIRSLSFLLVTASVTTASAQSRDDVIGIGFEGSLTPQPTLALGDTDVSLPLLAITVPVGDTFALEPMVGVGWAREELENPVDTTIDRLGIVAGGRFLWFAFERGLFRLGLLAGGGYRGVFGDSTAAGFDGETRREGLYAELGLRPELRLHPTLSLHGVFGFAYAFDRLADGDRAQGLAASGNLLGGFGATIWF